MEGFLFFIGGIAFVILIAWQVRASGRLKKLERQARILRGQLVELQKADAVEEPDEVRAETGAPTSPEKTAAIDLQRSQFAAAKQRAAEPELPPTPETVAPPAEIRSETETPAPETSGEPLPPPPPQIPETSSKPKPEKPAPKPIPPDEEEKPLIEWRPILEKLNLWPPSGENAEAAIGFWWLTRAGVIVGIIGAVFLGIRIAENVSPWLRIASLAGLSVGVTIFGAWLEKRLEAFGRLISVGGLAIGYFTAFAAFALPATKVIDDPAIGVLVQMIALAAMIGWSFWKEDKSIAAMAILLGFVSCGFSHHHDLDNFVIAGLLTLAAGGGLMLILRNWLWPHAIATAGSWGGFLILSIGEWSSDGTLHGFWLKAGEAPSFSVMMGCLLLLTIILEVSNFLAEERGGDSPESCPRERKWLAIINTSAAIAVGWIATRQVAPDQLENFFLSFAMLLFGITAIRYWRGHPTGLTETFFLKAVALLALFFVERFDGPTRWLSLAVEAGLVLFAWRRSHLRWIEIGFGAVFLGALGFIWKDVLTSPDPASWKVFGVPSLAGAATLVLLSAELAFHSLWSATKPDLEKNRENLRENPEPVQVFRLLAAVFTGLAGAAFAFNLLAENPQVSQSIYLSLVALALAAPAIWIRRFPPVMAGLAALVPAYANFIKSVFGLSNSVSGILAGVWLMLLAFALAEAAYRYWLDRWHCGNAVRALLSLLGILTLAEVIFRLETRFEFGTAGSVLAAVLFAAAGGLALIGLSRRFRMGSISGDNWTTHAFCQWLIAVLTGCLAVFVTLVLLEGNEFLGAWLAISGGILFASAFRTRNNIPAAAGGIPFLTGIYFYTIEFDSGSHIGTQLACALLIIAVGLGTSLTLWRVVDAEKFPIVRRYELLLQATGLFVIHWLFRCHLDTSEVFFADALLAAAVTAAGRFPCFRTLPVLSSLPLALALLHAGVTMLGGDWGPQAYWWLTAAVVFGWVWFLHSPSTEKDPVFSRPPFQIWNSGIAASVITVSGYQALDNPWHLVVLTVFAVILAALWRWEKIQGLHFWSALPLGFAAFGTLLRIAGTVEVEPTPGLIAASLTSLGIVGHGVLIAYRNPKFRSLMWVHGLVALGLTFLAYSPGTLNVSELTTVCWGIAAIVLFVIGLLAGLRPYRLTGLIGLGFCLVRMFFIDIDDPLYRIFAFFAIAIVLLVMGYLYHRFRDRIERADHQESKQEGSS